MEILDNIAKQTVTALHVRACSTRLLSPDGSRLFVATAHGLSSAYRAKGPVDIAASGIDQVAIAATSPIYVADARTDARLQYPEQLRREGIISMVLAPLRVQDRPIGVLRVYSDTQRDFTQDDLDLVEGMASLSAVAIESGRLYERLDRNYQAALNFGARTFE
jgi:GAF domain-containing protein